MTLSPRPQVSVADSEHTPATKSTEKPALTKDQQTLVTPIILEALENAVESVSPEDTAQYCNALADGLAAAKEIIENLPTPALNEINSPGEETPSLPKDVKDALCRTLQAESISIGGNGHTLARALQNMPYVTASFNLSVITEHITKQAALLIHERSNLR